MGERQRIPEGLAEMPPGPDLCAVLDAIDPRCLSGPDCVAVLRARARQVAHEQARFLAVMVQVGLCDPDGDGERVARLEEPPEWAADEIRAALVWTRRAAESRFWSAHDLMTRLPAVHRALDAGRIDQPRARVFAEWTEQLTIEQAHRICDLLLPIAAELTTGQLIARIRQMAIAIDPQWAERKYTEALKTRRVVGSSNPDGTANVSGLDLPVDQAAAACARIDALARRVKQAGDRRPIDMIRADLFLGMLDGTYQGCDDQEIIEHLLAQSSGGDSAGAERTTATGGPDAEHDGSPAQVPPAEDMPAGGPPVGDRNGAGAPGGRSARGGPVVTGVHLHVKLSTLLGLDEHPAEIAGWGFTHAANARAVAARQTGAQWRYVVCDDHGALLAEGLVARRPLGHPPRVPVRGGSVELQIPLALLHDLSADHGANPDWAAVIDQIHADVIGLGPGQPDPVPEHGVASERTTMAAAADADTADLDTADLDADDLDTDDLDTDGSGTADRDGVADRADETADRRFPLAGLRRKVRARDRTCQFPGCRMPAGATDTDHTRQWQDHGRTQEHNLASLCRHDHRIKDEGGWRLTRTPSGLLRWTSPLRQTYETRPPAIIIPLPDPRPRPQCRPSAWSMAADRAETDSPIWYEPRAGSPPDQGEPPPAPPRSDPSEDPPPF